MAERSKALRLRRTLSGGVGSNPTFDNTFGVEQLVVHYTSGIFFFSTITSTSTARVDGPIFA